ncbi:transporter substrate-binding domain-containing protein [Vibrio sp. SCSIO 43136]|uniref:transporter substrate-binding domain-containing protein n=1 Tax=Vibrio sp. SCSIO 43136 TaxID=2819101 RepID=UPI00207558F5|nr:transporter substrate-binding domain-containing protein [Vibrio sp. SCSIO 43136]USD67774.1 transporter substrate-binding domain-containing protein [Vibrio sp. SCSIO 43136]
MRTFYICSQLMKLSLLLLLSSVVLTVSAQTQQEDGNLQTEPFKMLISYPEHTEVYQVVTKIYRKLFDRLDMDIEFIYRPLKRGAMDISTGKYDGETGRSLQYENSESNVVRVREPLYIATLAAFVKGEAISGLNGWKSLQDTPYRVNYRRGANVPELNLPNLVNPKQLSVVNTADQGIKKLLLGRTDIYVDSKINVTSALQQFTPHDQQAVRQAGVLERVPLYMYLHKKHEDLEPKLRLMLIVIKRENVVEKAVNEVYQNK